MKKKKKNFTGSVGKLKAKSYPPECSRAGKLKAFAGFTLIEMIVSIALFSFVMLATTQVLLSVVDADHKAQGLKTSINNLSLALESVARNLRTGTGYTAVGSSAGCQPGGVDGVRFFDHANVSTTYSLGSGAIQIAKDVAPAAAMTAPELTIDRLCFYISGESQLDKTQPRILITVGGVLNKATVAGAKAKTTSRFDIETLVSQRFPDVPQN